MFIKAAASGACLHRIRKREGLCNSVWGVLAAALNMQETTFQDGPDNAIFLRKTLSDEVPVYCQQILQPLSVIFIVFPMIG